MVGSTLSTVNGLRITQSHVPKCNQTQREQWMKVNHVWNQMLEMPCNTDSTGKWATEQVDLKRKKMPNQRLTPNEHQLENDCKRKLTILDHSKSATWRERKGSSRWTLRWRTVTTRVCFVLTLAVGRIQMIHCRWKTLLTFGVPILDGRHSKETRASIWPTTFGLPYLWYVWVLIHPSEMHNTASGACNEGWFRGADQTTHDLQLLPDRSNCCCQCWDSIVRCCHYWGRHRGCHCRCWWIRRTGRTCLGSHQRHWQVKILLTKYSRRKWRHRSQRCILHVPLDWGWWPTPQHLNQV